MFFWNIYSHVYDKLNELIPYSQHLSELEKLMNYDKQKLYFDAGCGTGNFIKNRSNIVGIDSSTTMLAIAKEKNPDCVFIHANLNCGLSFSDNSFDGGVSNNVLAYLNNPDRFLSEIYRILKPGGVFVLATLRPSFNPAKILLEHIRKASFSSVLINIVYILFILILNLPIVFRLKRKTYHGYEIESLKLLAESRGFKVGFGAYSYAAQDVILLTLKG